MKKMQKNKIGSNSTIYLRMGHFQSTSTNYSYKNCNLTAVYIALFSFLIQFWWCFIQILQLIIKSFLLEEGITLPKNWIVCLQFVLVKAVCRPAIVNLTLYLGILTLFTFVFALEHVQKLDLATSEQNTSASDYRGCGLRPACVPFCL